MTTANNEAYVTAGKPRIAGAVYRAPAGTTLPTDAKTTLTSAFKCLGFVSEDGVSNPLNLTVDGIKEWGGAVVLNTVSEMKDQFKFKLIEFLNDEGKKWVYGDDNVTGTLGTKLEVKVGDINAESCVLVIDIILKGDYLHRIVVPYAYIAGLGDIVYKANEVVGYDITVTGIKDSAGYSHYEYTEATPAAA